MADQEENQGPMPAPDEVEVEDQMPMMIVPKKNRSLWVIIVVPMIILVIVSFLAASLMPQAKYEEAVASMNERYPGYTGDVSPSGSVIVTFLPQRKIQFNYNLQGLESNCIDCGIHIHEGTTCDDADEVGGHYYSVEVDPWTTEGGAVYKSDVNGQATAHFTLTSGYDTYNENVGHAVVIHSQNGTRLSCGILMAKT
ncbi:MAG: superoxide dismutase family protein [Paracoccaceae bacterium]